MFFWLSLAVLYILALATVGTVALRNGHWMMFILGFAFPLVWLLGALIGPTERMTRPGPVGSSQVRYS